MHISVKLCEEERNMVERKEKNKKKYEEIEQL